MNARPNRARGTDAGSRKSRQRKKAREGLGTK